MADLIGPFPLGQLRGGRGDSAAVRDEDALGLPRGAARIGDTGDVVGLHRRRHQRARGETRCQFADGAANAAFADCQQMPEARRPICQFAGDIFEGLVVDQRIDGCIADDIEIVLQRSHGVQRGRDDPGKGEGIEHPRDFRPVFREQRGALRSGRERFEQLDIAADRIAQLASRNHTILAKDYDRAVEIMVQRMRDKIGPRARMVQTAHRRAICQAATNSAGFGDTDAPRPWRSSSPAVAPVHSLPLKVTTPFTSVQ